jgi:hypothetical protein
MSYWEINDQRKHAILDWNLELKKDISRKIRKTPNKVCNLIENYVNINFLILVNLPVK